MSVRAFNRDERCVMRKTREEKETSDDESFFFAHEEHEAANEVFLSAFVYNIPWDAQFRILIFCFVFSTKLGG